MTDEQIEQAGLGKHHKCVEKGQIVLHSALVIPEVPLSNAMQAEMIGMFLTTIQDLIDSGKEVVAVDVENIRKPKTIAWVIKSKTPHEIVLANKGIKTLKSFVIVGIAPSVLTDVDDAIQVSYKPSKQETPTPLE